MEVKDRLPAVAALIENEPVAVGRQTFLRCQLGGGGEEGGQQGRVPGGQGGHSVEMLIGNDQNMRGRLRVNVAEGGDQVILIDDSGRQISGGDLAEKAGHKSVGYGSMGVGSRRQRCWQIRQYGQRANWNRSGGLTALWFNGDEIIKTHIHARLVKRSGYETDETRFEIIIIGFG